MMIRYLVTFYYKDHPALYGEFEIYADSKGIAMREIKHMVDTKDPRVPGNWDRYDCVRV